LRRSALVVVAIMALAGCGGDDGGASDVSTDAGVTAATAATVPAGEPVTAAEAATLPDGTEVTVRAYAFEPDEGATVLCDLLGESLPPTCVGSQLVTNGLDINRLPGVETTDPGDFVAPATWTSRPVEVTGTLVDGALQVDA
jgi:hypothetical protein